MSKIIFDLGIKGAYKIVEKAFEKYEDAVKKFGKEAEVGFPNTAYYLPIIYAILGYPVKKLGDCEEVLQEAKKLLPNIFAQKNYLPYLGEALDAGMATFFAEEIIEAIKYLENPNLYTKTEEPTEDNIWLGAADDVIFRKRGVEFVDGTAPGFAALLGSPPDKETAKNIVQDFLEKGLYVFMHDQTNGVYMPYLLKEAGIQLGWPVRLVPFGPYYTSIVFAIGFACRVAMSFGGVKPGDYINNLLFNKYKTFAFVIAFGPPTEEWIANALGAFNWGIPVICDWTVPEIKIPGICIYEALVSKPTHCYFQVITENKEFYGTSVPEIASQELIEKALEVRGLKVTQTKLNIPVPYAPAFEGERVRKEDLYLECGGGRTPAVELLISSSFEEVKDGEIKIIGHEISDLPKIEEKGPPYKLPLAIVVKVAGANMQEDFEPIIERQFHYFINYAQGIMHIGQRNMVWIRIGKQAVEKGFLLKHIGEILYSRIKQDFSTIVDKCEINIYTEEEKVKEIIEKAKKIYEKRDARLAGMADESVEEFYSCTLCQSFAPTHVCVITPERGGPCGAYSWLDAKAYYQINPAGPNQPILKGEVINSKLGQFKGVNEFVKKHSKEKVERVSLYSIIIDPLTVCGCMEAIAAVSASVNGIIIVNREFNKETPIGLKFSTLAGMIGGGQVTPGFLGISKQYITSKKFISAEDGFLRIVWMPKMLKEELKEKLQKRAEELGVPDFIEKIADETVVNTEEELVNWVKRVNHPVLSLPPIM
ncbi:MAG: CO dehydrogenase/CO-methylating acetyl-CoA synthase complex subunit beta [Thermodesulfobacterium geofontis]|uniref:CO-methylating acetyl-CoA synthase n=2 Tax=Thermodesulfobacterium geofontis TaxID=1295609 RepID=A0A2N7PLZ8_9BACT|nr:MAG: CO dehydrogenase/CO-methylating acetyl-CoA synthase complex subunit beta [Thermodesulfobacterium geofontis]